MATILIGHGEDCQQRISLIHLNPLIILMSLYLKYRPQSFETIVGQQHVITTLKNAEEKGSISHAYLFSGPRGTGKTSTARILAKRIMVSGLETDKADIIAQTIDEGRMVDLIEIDAASNRGIDEIRDLREKIQFAPNQAKAKVYIIDEVHMLTKEAFNALLKTLEEPPEHAYFVLATTEVHKIPETIISRCQQFNFKRISNESISARLMEIASEEGVSAEADAIQLIAKQSNGGLRDAIGLFEQMAAGGKLELDYVIENLGLSGQMLVEAFYKALIEKKPNAALEVIETVNSKGQSLSQFTSEFISFLREQMLLGVSNNADVGATIDMIDIFGVAKQQIKEAIIPQLPLEVAVVKACGKATKTIAPVEAKKEKVIEVKQEKKVEEVAEVKEETPVSISEEINLESIKKNWKQLADQIETPFIRVSFMDGEPVKYQDNELTLSFKSSTLMEKVANPSNQSVVQKAFETVFSQKVTLKLEVKQIDLKPVTEVKVDKPSSVVDMAKEVFGN